MGVSRATARVFMGTVGGLQVLAGVATMLVTYRCLDRDTVKCHYEHVYWLPTFFVYGVCTAVVVLGLFCLVSCKFSVPGCVVLCL